MFFMRRWGKPDKTGPPINGQTDSFVVAQRRAQRAIHASCSWMARYFLSVGIRGRLFLPRKFATASAPDQPGLTWSGPTGEGVSRPAIRLGPQQSQIDALR